MLCLKKRRTYSFTQGVCADLPRRSKKDNHRYEESLNMAITTLPRKNRSREERPSRMVLTVTEDTPADMLAGSMELLVQLPRDHHLQTQRVTVQRSTPMMDLLVQIATAHKLAASSYTLQAIGERGLVLPHQPNTPIGALDALQVKLLPKQGTFVPRKAKQANQPFETTFRLQVHLPRNQLYVSRVSPKMNLGEILEEVCREKNLDKNKYELRHPANLEETLDLSLSLQDYHLQEVTLYAKQGRTLGSALSTQDIMALQKQEERRRQQARQGVFGFVFKKSKEGSLSTDSLGGRSASPARSDETGRSASPLQPPARPQRKRRPAPKPPIQAEAELAEENADDPGKDKVVISHSRNSSDSSGYHEASVLSDNPDSAGRLPETLPRRNRVPMETPRKLAHTSQSSKSLGNLATVSGMLTRGISSTSLSSAGLKKKRLAPPPPVTRPLSSAISTQALERIVDSEESLTSDIDPSKPPSDIGAPSKANSVFEDRPKANSDIGVTTVGSKSSKAIEPSAKLEILTSETETGIEASKSENESRCRSGSINIKLSKGDLESTAPVEEAPIVEARVSRKRVEEPAPLPKPRKTNTSSSASVTPKAPKRRVAPRFLSSKSLEFGKVECLSNAPASLIEAESSIAEISDNDVDPTPGSDMRETKNSRTSSFEFDVKSEKKSEQEIAIDDDEIPLKDEIKKNETKNEAPILACNSNQKIPENENNLAEIRTNSKHEKISCAVISTLPKCDHLDNLTRIQSPIKTARTKRQKRLLANNQESTGLIERDVNFFTDNQSEYSTINADDEYVVRKEYEQEARRIKVFRSASKTNDFETNSLERQKRHLTSQVEDITYALNLNLSSNIDLLSNASKRFDEPRREDRSKREAHCGDVGEAKSQRGLGISDVDLSETDILLQKVSDTLSNSLPTTPTNELPAPSIDPDASRSKKDQVEAKSPTIQVSSRKMECTKVRKPVQNTDDSRKTQKEENDIPDGRMNASSSNVTLGSQQDTSDYVSAVDEDLSIADWEYQLPAPPSAFRDTASPVFEKLPDVASTSRSNLARNMPEMLGRINIAFTSKERTKSPSDNVVEKPNFLRENSESSVKNEGKKEVFESKYSKPSLKSETSLKKEIISELENKIGLLPQKECESKRVDNSSTPKVAPVDNTLSNFTITTYTRPKTLNIFDEVEEQSRGRTEDRFVRSFATLARSRSNCNESEHRSGAKDFTAGSLQSNKERTNKTEETNGEKEGCKNFKPKIHERESLQRWQSVSSADERNNIQRSKSYVSVCDNEKYREEVRERNEDKSHVTPIERNDVRMKSTSITNLSAAAPKSNEKFSQWRDNILKRQEEPTKERQLQSLQVLKSILPQLKSAQQAEENVSKEHNEAVLTEKTRSETAPNEHSIPSNVISSRDSQGTSNPKKVDTQPKKSTEESNPKRYTYSGPPAISLGSWSERPSVNVQIKMDTDYKLGMKKITNGKTIVNINGSKDERDYVNSTTMSNKSSTKINEKFDTEKEGLSSSNKNEFGELSKKLITHTTASGFKKPTLNKVHSESKKVTVGIEKPIVTGVELKKTFNEKTEPKRGDSAVDTAPVSFKELTKAFGQDVFLRSKPKRVISNRRSDFSSIKPEIIQQIESSRQNGHASIERSDSSNDQSLMNGAQRPKRFTSIIGINSQNQGQNVTFRNNINVKSSQPMPVVKGFKVTSVNGTSINQNGSTKESSIGAPQPPRPPTMPVITGVTLKSARPKSMPVQADSRDVLLESIRNFGGRGNLKSPTERC